MKRIKKIITSMLFVLVALTSVVFSACDNNNDKMTITLSSDNVQIVLGENDNTQTITATVKDATDDSVIVLYDSSDIKITTNYVGDGVTEIKIVAYRQCSNVDVTVKGIKKSAHFFVSATLPISSIAPKELKYHVAYDKTKGGEFVLSNSLFNILPQGTNQTQLEYRLLNAIEGVSIINNKLVLSSNLSTSVTSVSVEVISAYKETIKTTIDIDVVRVIDVENIQICDESGNELDDDKLEFNISRNNPDTAILSLIVRVPFSVANEPIAVEPKFTYQDKGLLQQNDAIISKDEIGGYYQYLFTFIVDEKNTTAGTDFLYFDLYYPDYPDVKSSTVDKTNGKIKITTFDEISDISCKTDEGFINLDTPINLYTKYYSQNKIEGYSIKFEAIPTTATSNKLSLNVNIADENLKFLTVKNSMGNEIVFVNGKYLFESGEEFYFIAKEGFNDNTGITITVKSEENELIQKDINFVFKKGISEFGFVYDGVNIQNNRNYYLNNDANSQFSSVVLSFVVNPKIDNINLESIENNSNNKILKYSTFTISASGDMFNFAEQDAGDGQLVYLIEKGMVKEAYKYDLKIQSVEGKTGEGLITIKFESGQEVSCRIIVVEELSDVKVNIDPTFNTSSAVGNINYDESSINYLAVKMGQSLPLVFNSNATYNSVSYGFYDIDADFDIEDGLVPPTSADLYSSNSNVISANYLRAMSYISPIRVGKVWVKASFTGKEIKLSDNGLEYIYADKIIDKYFLVEIYVPITSFNASSKTIELYAYDEVGEFNKNLSTTTIDILFNNGLTSPTYDDIYWDFWGDIKLEQNVVYEFKATNSNVVYFTVENLGGGKFKFTALTRNADNEDSIFMPTTLSISAKDLGLDKNIIEYSINIVIKEPILVENIIASNVADNGIYLITQNLKGIVNGETSFKILTKVEPDNALNKDVAFRFIPNVGTPSNVLNISDDGLISVVGNYGGSGIIRILPKDGIFVDDLGNEYYRDNIVYCDIPVTIGDGTTRETSIRIQSLNEIVDGSFHYTLVNSVSYPQVWNNKPDTFNGGLYGKIEGNDFIATITLNDECLFNTLGINGLLEDLIVCGQVTSQAMLVNTNNGLIKNITVDIYNQNGKYVASKVETDQSSAGGLVNINYGKIENSTFSGSIIAPNGVVGGICAINYGTVSNSNVLIYNMQADSQMNFDGQIIGGLVGEMTENSRLEKSYIYNFSTDANFDTKVMGALVGMILSNNIVIEQCFAEIGQTSSFYVSKNASVNKNDENLIKNSYIISKFTQNVDEQESLQIKFSYFMTQNNGKYVFGTTQNTSEVFLNVSMGTSQIWNRNSTSNYGFPYLTKVVTLKALTGEDLQNIQIQNSRLSLAEDNGVAVMYLYKANGYVLTDYEKQVLNMINTISLNELFGVDKVDGLIVSSNNSNVIDCKTSEIQVKNLGMAELTLQSKYDLSVAPKTIIVYVIYATNNFTLSYKGQNLLNDATISIKNGVSDSLQSSITSTIVLSNREIPLMQNNFEVIFDVNDEESKFIVGKNIGTHTIVSKFEQEDGTILDSVDFDIYLKLIDTIVDTENSNKIQQIIKQNTLKRLNVFRTHGALSISSTINSATISASDELDIGITAIFDEKALNKTVNIEIYNSEWNDVSMLNIFENITLSKISETQNNNNTETIKFSATIKINKSLNSSKIDLNGYTIRFISDEYVYADVKINVLAQEILRVDVNNYAQKESSLSGSSYNYFPNNVLSPGTSGLLDIMVYPSYANYTHINVTAQPVNNQSVSLIAMKKNDNATYDIDLATNFEFIENGVKIYAKETASEVGRYYVRVVVPSTVNVNTSYNIYIDIYNNNEKVYTEVYSLLIVPQEKAGVTVEGKDKIFAVKGDTITADVVYEQTQQIESIIAYDMNTTNVNKNVTIINNQDFSSYATKYFKGTLSITLGENCGNVDIQVTTSRYVNGVKEEVYSILKIYVIDFELDFENTHLNNETGSDVVYGDKYFYNSLEFKIAGKYVKGENGLITSSERAYNTFIKNNYYLNNETGYEVNYSTKNKDTLIENLFYVNGNEYTPIVVKNNDGTYSTVSSDIIADFVIEEQTVNGEIQKVIKFLGKNIGTQRMLLEIKAKMPDGSIRTYQYFFDIVIANYVTEEQPEEISNADEFLNAFTGDIEQDYILTNDIILYDFSPIQDTSKIKSLDGNGYQIIIRSFSDSVLNQSTVSLSLFQNVSSNTTIKNLRLNIYHVDAITIDSNITNQVNIAPIAINNSGIITNTEVVSYRYLANQITPQISGLNIKANSTLNVSAQTSGFVLNNSGIITNSRVGGESINVYNVNDKGSVTYETIYLEPFVISSFGEISGFVHTNTGRISSSFVSNLREINNSNIDYTTITSGFVIENSGRISMSYAKGVKENSQDIHATKYGIETSGISAGFVYSNSGNISDSYANITLTNLGDNPGRTSAGFVYNNQSSGVVKTSLSLSRIIGATTTQMNFSGVDDWGNWQNFGTIENSYYYDAVALENSNILIEEAYGESASLVSSVTLEEYFYGYSFATNEQNDDGIWVMTTTGPELISANTKTVSLRYYSQQSSDEDMPMLNYATNYEYGSLNNPILIRNAQEFNSVFSGISGTSASKFVNLDKKQAFGNYRLINDIDLQELVSSDDEQTYRLASSNLTLTGIYREEGNGNGIGKFDGNGFTISGFALSDSYVESTADNFGMFATIESGAIVMNVNVIIGTTNAESEVLGVEAKNIKYVGAIAGTVYDSKVVNVNLVSAFENTNTVTVRGKNIVGGLIGRVIGNSYIFNLSSTNVSVTAAKFPDYYTSGASYTTYNQYSRLNETQNNNISYAGGIVGIIDTYNDDSITQEMFADSIISTNGNAIMLKTIGTSQIAAGTVGGVIGYVGPLTIVQDALYELSYVDTQNRNMQGLYSYNGFAGGIVGYNKGYLRQVRSEHEENWQINIIEDGVDDYYKGNYSVDRGNEQLFVGSSYNPIAIGGLVGLNVSGKIEKSYSKLNVITDALNSYAGGIVGINEKPTTSQTDYIKLSLNEVYAFGDVSASVAGGIIGLNKGGFDFDKVNAVNYWSNKLIDENYFNKTYAVSLNENANNSYKTSTALCKSLIKFNGTSVSSTNFYDDEYVSNITSLSNITGVGDDGELYDGFFTGNGWEKQSWERDEDELFPHILFGYITKIRYIRNQDDIDLLRVSTNDDIFVIDPDNSIENEDGLIGITKRIAPITNFSGTLRSLDNLNPSGFLFKTNQNRALFSSTNGATFYNFIVKYNTNIEFNSSLSTTAILVGTANDTTFNKLKFKNVTLNATLNTSATIGIVTANAKGTTVFSDIEISYCDMNISTFYKNESEETINVGMLFGTGTITTSQTKSGGIFDITIQSSNIFIEGKFEGIVNGRNESSIGLIGGNLQNSTSDGTVMPSVINNEISGTINVKCGLIQANVGYLFGYTSGINISSNFNDEQTTTTNELKPSITIWNEENISLLYNCNIGGIVGKASNSNISDVVIYPKININAISRIINIGGVAGRFESGNISNCEVKAINETSKNGIIKESTNKISILNIDYSNENNIGSLIGYAVASEKNNIDKVKSYIDLVVSICNKDSEGEIVNNIGGLVGNVKKYNISNAIYYANINYSSRNASDTTKDLVDTTSIGGLVGSGISLSLANVYSTGDITNNANIDEKTQLTLTIGGIVANLDGGENKSEIKNSIASGNVYPSYEVKEENDGSKIITKSKTNITKLNIFYYGGLVGNAKGEVQLASNISINTLFNKLDRQLAETYSANALVGNTSENASVIDTNNENTVSTNKYAHVYTLTTDDAVGENMMLNSILNSIITSLNNSDYNVLDKNYFGEDKDGTKLYPYTYPNGASSWDSGKEYYYLGTEDSSYTFQIKELTNTVVVSDGAQIIFEKESNVEDNAKNSPIASLDNNSIVSGVVVLANYNGDENISSENKVISGFVETNAGIIYSCNVRGRLNGNQKITGSITTNLRASAFVFSNSGLIKECYTSVDVVSYDSQTDENNVVVAGFVISNDGLIYNCYSSGSIQNYNPNETDGDYNGKMYLFGPGNVYDSFSNTRLVDLDIRDKDAKKRFAFDSSSSNCFYDAFACEAMLSNSNGGEAEKTNNIALGYEKYEENEINTISDNYDGNLKVNKNYNFGYGSFIDGAYTNIEYMWHSTGVGSQDNPYQVPNLGKLQQLPSSQEDETTYYVLINNINAEYISKTIDWQSKDISNINLSGYDGISELHYIKNLSTLNGGLFANVENSTISLLILENITIDLSENYIGDGTVGFLANKVTGMSNINNIEIRTIYNTTASIKLDDTKIKTLTFGNVVGSLGDNSTLSSCNLSSITSTKDRTEYVLKLSNYNINYIIGGMVGVLNGGTVENSSLTKPIYVDFAENVKMSDKTIIFGGIVGLQNYGSIENSYINQSIHLFDGELHNLNSDSISYQDKLSNLGKLYSDISKLKLYAGGIVGSCSDVITNNTSYDESEKIIDSCYILSNVEIIAGNSFAFDTTYLGGISGYGGNISNCYSKARSIIGHATYSVSDFDKDQAQKSDGISIGDNFHSSVRNIYSESGLGFDRYKKAIYRTVTQKAHVAGIANDYDSLNTVVNYCDNIQGGMESRNLYSYYDVNSWMVLLYDFLAFTAHKSIILTPLPGYVLLLIALNAPRIDVNLYYFSGNGYDYKNTDDYFAKIYAIAPIAWERVWYYGDYKPFMFPAGYPTYSLGGEGFDIVKNNVKNGIWMDIQKYSSGEKDYYYTEDGLLYIKQVYFDSIGTSAKGASANDTNGKVYSTAGQALEEIKISKEVEGVTKTTTYYGANDNSSVNGQGNVFNKYGLVYSLDDATYNNITQNTKIEDEDIDVLKGKGWEQCADGTWVPRDSVEVKKTDLSTMFTNNIEISQDENEATIKVSNIEDYRMLEVLINDLPEEDSSRLNEFWNEYTTNISYNKDLEVLYEIIKNSDEPSYTIKFVSNNGRTNISLDNVLPLGTKNYPFNGDVEGVNYGESGYYTLNNVITSTKKDGSTSGLFGYVKYLDIKNLNILYSNNNNIVVKSNNQYDIGGIVGTVVSNEIISSDSGEQISSISKNPNIIIKNVNVDYKFKDYIDVQNKDSVYSTSSNNIGALIGKTNNANIEIEQVKDLGCDITLKNIGSDNEQAVGGLIGLSENSIVNIIGVNETINISSSSSNKVVGGVIGKSKDSQITLQNIDIFGNIINEINNQSSVISGGVFGIVEQTNEENALSLDTINISLKEISAKASVKGVKSYSAGIIGYLHGNDTYFSQIITNETFKNINVGRSDYIGYEQKTFIMSGLNATEYSEIACADYFVGNRNEFSQTTSNIQNNETIKVYASALAVSKPNYNDLPAHDENNKITDNGIKQSVYAKEGNLGDAKKVIKVETFEYATEIDKTEGNAFINGEQYTLHNYKKDYYVVVTEIQTIKKDNILIDGSEPENDIDAIYAIVDRVYRLRIVGSMYNQGDYNIVDNYNFEFIVANEYIVTVNPYQSPSNVYKMTDRKTDFLPTFDASAQFLKQNGYTTDDDGNIKQMNYISVSKQNAITTYDNSINSKYSVKNNIATLNINVVNESRSIENGYFNSTSITTTFVNLQVVQENNTIKLKLNQTETTSKNSGDASLDEGNQSGSIENGQGSETVQEKSETLIIYKDIYTSNNGNWGSTSVNYDINGNVKDVADLAKNDYTYTFNVDLYNSHKLKIRDDIKHTDDSGLKPQMYITTGPQISIDGDSNKTYKTFIISTKENVEDSWYKDYVFVVDKNLQIAYLGYVSYTLQENSIEVDSQTNRNKLFFPYGNDIIIEKYENHLLSLHDLQFSSSSSLDVSDFEFKFNKTNTQIDYLITKNEDVYKIKETKQETIIENTIKISNISVKSLNSISISFNLEQNETKDEQTPDEQTPNYKSKISIDNLGKSLEVLSDVKVDGIEITSDKGFVIDNKLNDDDLHNGFYYYEFDYEQQVVNRYKLDGIAPNFTKGECDSFDFNGNPLSTTITPITNNSQTAFKVEYNYSSTTNTTMFRFKDSNNNNKTSFITLQGEFSFIDNQDGTLTISKDNLTYVIKFVNNEFIVQEIDYVAGFGETKYSIEEVHESATKKVLYITYLDKTIKYEIENNEYKNILATSLTGKITDTFFTLALQNEVNESTNIFLAINENGNEKSLVNLSTDLTYTIYAYEDRQKNTLLYIYNQNAVQDEDVEMASNKINENSLQSLYVNKDGVYECVINKQSVSNFMKDYYSYGINSLNIVPVYAPTNNELHLFDTIQITFDNDMESKLNYVYKNNTIYKYDLNEQQLELISSFDGVSVNYYRYDFANDNNAYTIMFIDQYNTVLNIDYKVAELDLIPFGDDYAIKTTSEDGTQTQYFTLRDGYIISGEIGTKVIDDVAYSSFGITQNVLLVYNNATYTNDQGEVISVDEYVLIKNQISLTNAEEIIDVNNGTIDNVTRNVTVENNKCTIADTINYADTTQQAIIYQFNLFAETLHFKVENEDTEYLVVTESLYGIDATEKKQLQRTFIKIGDTKVDAITGIVIKA